MKASQGSQSSGEQDIGACTWGSYLVDQIWYHLTSEEFLMFIAVML